MINKVLLTAINEGYIKSSYSLDHVGLGEALAWFAFFDGNLRRSGKDGEYFNAFVSDDELLETCVIDNEKEYHKKCNSKIFDNMFLYYIFVMVMCCVLF